MSPWISFTENKKKYRARQKCSRGGSNSRPSDYETDALPTELLKHYFLFQPRNNTRPVEKYRLSNIQLFLLFPLVNSR